MQRKVTNHLIFQEPDCSLLPSWSLIVGGRFEEKGSGAAHDQLYPGTGTISMGSNQDVDKAVSAACNALPAWREMPGDKGRNLMMKLAELLEAKAADFVLSLVAKNGSISRAAPCMPRDAAQKFRYFGRRADKIQFIGSGTTAMKALTTAAKTPKPYGLKLPA